MLVQLLLIVPESRFRGPNCSGVSTNVPCDFPGQQIFMSIATRCFAASGPAAATDVSTNAAASAASMVCRAFTAYLLETRSGRCRCHDRAGPFQVRFRPQQQSAYRPRDARQTVTGSLRE